MHRAKSSKAASNQLHNHDTHEVDGSLTKPEAVNLHVWADKVMQDAVTLVTLLPVGILTSL